MKPDELKPILEAHKEWWQSGGANGKRAYLRGADLSGADLRGADLSGAYLRGADLRWAYLRGADLRGADLSGADLSGADLRGAYLRGADLSGADLRGAYLRGAYLRGADLRGADLSGAYLRGAYLRGAYLRGADLRGADLRGADLRGAYLSDVKKDLFEVLSAAPAEVPVLLKAVKAGKIDGTAYQGDCACLVGTIANARSCDYRELNGLKPNADRPAERWFLGLSPGHTPKKSQIAAITAEWIEEWMKANPAKEAIAK